jgi:O-antigen ligase
MTLTALFRYSVFGFLVAVCLLAGIMTQQLEYWMLILVLGFLGFWVVTVLVFKPSVMTTLLFIAVCSLKPTVYSFYFCLGFLIISLLAEYTGKERPRLMIPFPVMLAVLFLAGVQALFNARDFGDGFEYFSTTILVPILTILVVTNSGSKESDLTTWSRFLVVVGFILGFIGVMVALLNPSSRIGSLWITAMTINGFYILVFFLTIGLLLQHRNALAKYIYVFMAVIIFLGMLYTYTRVTLVAVAFGFFLLTLRVKNLRKIVFLFILLTPLLIPSSMIYRIKTGFTTDLSMVIRVIAWYHAIIQIGKHFLLGIGFNTWRHMYSSLVPYRILYTLHPHNVFLRVMVETGIFGFLAYFGIIASILVKYYRNCVKPVRGEFNYAVFVAVAAVLFACLTDVFIQQVGVSLPFWITLALMYKKALNAEEKAGKPL